MGILRRIIPHPDACRVEMCLVDAPAPVVYRACLETDFLDAVRSSIVVRILFALRSAAERLMALIRRRPFAEPATPASLFLKDIPERGEWIRLGAASEHEFAFGVVGRFWAGETRWMVTDPDEFCAFDEPGFAKIGCTLMVNPRRDGSTLLIYEARTLATDDASRKAFRRYWMLVSPFVGFIMRTTLKVIARNAAAAALTYTVPPNSDPQPEHPCERAPSPSPSSSSRRRYRRKARSPITAAPTR